jgi:hypothetical protein
MAATARRPARHAPGAVIRLDARRIAKPRPEASSNIRLLAVASAAMLMLLLFMGLLVS